MADQKEAAGIESSLVKSWEGWDEMDTSDLYFYDVILREEYSLVMYMLT